MKSGQIVASVIVALFVASTFWMMFELARPALVFGPQAPLFYHIALLTHWVSGVMTVTLALVVAGWITGQRWLSGLGWVVVAVQGAVALWSILTLTWPSMLALLNTEYLRFLTWRDYLGLGAQGILVPAAAVFATLAVARGIGAVCPYWRPVWA